MIVGWGDGQAHYRETIRAWPLEYCENASGKPAKSSRLRLGQDIAVTGKQFGRSLFAPIIVTWVRQT